MNWRKRMRYDPNFGIFHRAFSSRIEVAAVLAEALKPSQHDFESLKKAVWSLKNNL